MYNMSIMRGEFSLKSDPILTTHRLYKWTMYAALHQAKKMYLARSESACIKLLHKLISLAQHALDLEDVVMLNLMIANLEFSRKEYDLAMKYAE